MKTSLPSTNTSNASPKNSKTAATDLLLGFHQPVQGVLVKRYKRFFADVVLADGSTVVSHCTNTGSMKAVCVPGQPVILSRAQNPERKLQYTWEAIKIGKSWVGVNTANPNKIVGEALMRGLITEVDTFDAEIQREVVAGPGCRLDFAITSPGNKFKTFIEVKNVTLAESFEGKTVAFFPDSVSERATKHLLTLEKLAKEGHRAIVLFVVQRLDCHQVRGAHHIDEVYAKTLSQVAGRGVEALAYTFEVTQQGIVFSGSLDVAT